MSEIQIIQVAATGQGIQTIEVESNGLGIATIDLRQGATGATGATGPAGPTGANIGFPYLFNVSTTAADPGSGYWAANSSTPASITALYISKTDSTGSLRTGFISTFDDSTSATKGVITFANSTGGGTLAFQVSATMTDSGTYFTIPVTWLSTTLPGAGAIRYLTFSRTGDIGSTGAAGPNTITTSTSSNLTGFIAANGTNVSGATAGTTAATANTLVLRDATGGTTFAGIVTAPRIAGRCDGLEVFCKAGLAINAGQVVYITGASGNNIIIGLAQANAELTSSKTIGISESTLATNGTGYVITEGLLTVSISAPTAVEGDPIWLSPTTAGGMVFGLANKPTAPNHMVYLGVVTRKTGSTIVEIFVKVQNGSELDELADVLITSPTSGQALMRGATLWENRSLVAADISNSTTAGRALLTAADAAAQRTALGLGTAATTNTGTGATNTILGNDARLTDARTPLSHTHGNITNDGKIGTTATLPIITTTGGTLTTGSFGTTAGTFTQGDDSRLSDERVPTSAGIASKINGATAKTTLVDADETVLTDSAASFGLKKVTWANVFAYIQTKLEAAANIVFTGQLRSTNQTAATADALMTRSLSDARYGRIFGAALAAGVNSDTNTTTYKTVTELSFALDVGTYYIDCILIHNGNANYATSGVKDRLNFTGTATATGTLYRILDNATTSASVPNSLASRNTIVESAPTNRSQTTWRKGVLTVTVAGNLQVQIAQTTAVAASNTTLDTGSQLIIHRIP